MNSGILEKIKYFLEKYLFTENIIKLFLLVIVFYCYLFTLLNDEHIFRKINNFWGVFVILFYLFKRKRY